MSYGLDRLRAQGEFILALLLRVLPVSSQQRATGISTIRRLYT